MKNFMKAFCVVIVPVAAVITVASFIDASVFAIAGKIKKHKAVAVDTSKK